MDLENFFKNKFASKQISFEHLQLYSEDSIQRAASNNESGLFTVTISETTAIHESFFGAVISEETNLAVRKSNTLATDNIIETFKSEISRREGTIKSEFGKDSPTYLEFYPHGISEYTNATKANVEMLIDRMLNAANKHSAEVGSNFVDIFSSIKSNYSVARKLQLAKKGDVSSDKITKKASRTDLEIQLTKNLHYVGWLFPCDVDKCMSFFDQSIIRPQHSAKKDSNVPPATV